MIYGLAQTAYAGKVSVWAKCCESAKGAFGVENASYDQPSV